MHQSSTTMKRTLICSEGYHDFSPQFLSNRRRNHPRRWSKALKSDWQLVSKYSLCLSLIIQDLNCRPKSCGRGYKHIPNGAYLSHESACREVLYSKVQMVILLGSSPRCVTSEPEPYHHCQGQYGCVPTRVRAF